MESKRPDRSLIDAKSPAGESKPDHPRVSFAIPVCNAERFLGRAINSLLDQEFKDIEIVVSDNASTDGTRDLMQGFSQRDKRVRYIRNEKNIGQIENFNRVCELARSVDGSR